MQTESTANLSKSILLVDDDRLILSTLTSGLSRAGYHVSAVESVDEAWVWLEENDLPDLVILDVRMPNRDGFELTKRLEELHHIPFILLTAYNDQDIIMRAASSGAMTYLVKPININQLVPAIETALSRAQELQSLRGAKQQLQSALDADRAISIAVGIVMDQHQMHHEAALEYLRNTARSKQLKLIELAASIVNARETLNLSIS